MEKEQELTMTAKNHDIPAYTRRCCITSGEQSTIPVQPKQEMLSVVQEEAISASDGVMDTDNTEEASCTPIETRWNKIVRVCRRNLRWILALDVKAVQLPVAFHFKTKFDKRSMVRFLKEFFYHK